jgi:hypothetical protein
MKHSIFFLSILSFLFIPNVSYAQNGYAVPFLTFPVSPATTSMGVTGASLPSDDPYGFLLNPAQLGYTSQTNNFSFSVYPGSSELWGRKEFAINNLALNLGYNFKDHLGLPISAGLGYSRTSYNFDNFWYSNDIYSTFSFGVGIDYYVQFNAGISLKHISSKLTASTIEEGHYIAEATGNALDFGLLLNIPVIKLIDSDLNYDWFENLPLNPFLNVSAGYSQLNNGDEIYYLEPLQADPLPRLAKLGYGLSIGFTADLNKQQLKVIGFDFTVDAEDLLLKYRIESDSLFPVMSRDGYQSFIGDINIGKNIFSIKGDDKVASKTGWKIELFEIFSYRVGHLNGGYYDNYKTFGYEIKSDGFLKFISSQENPSIKYISEHFGLRFSYSNYSLREDTETDYYGISFFVKDFNSLF